MITAILVDRGLTLSPGKYAILVNNAMAVEKF